MPKNYKLTDSPDMVIRLEDGASIPRGHRWWVEYEEWLAAGGTPSPAFSLADEKATQSASIDQAYSAAVTADISFTTAASVTASFQADADSQQVLAVSVQGYDMAGSVPDGFFWKAADNTQVAFTLADLKGLYQAMLARGWVAFQRKTALKAEIATATTVAAVQAITW